MQVLRFATRAHIDSAFAENHALWGRPLTPEQYHDYWIALFQTPWGGSNLRYMALTEEEDGPLLSTLKLYRLEGRLFGKPIVIAAIGALYTQSEQRTFGHASLLVSEVLDYMQKKRAEIALLFTEIGLPFYERLGFVELPAPEATGGVPEGEALARPSPEGIDLRNVELGDARSLASYHKTVTADRPFAIDRDPAYWEFLLFRRFRFWELAPAGTGTPISLVALREGRPVALGFAVASGEGLLLQELTLAPGEEASFRALLDRIWQEARRRGARIWYGRLPEEMAQIDPRLAGEIARPASAQPMAAALGAAPDLSELAAGPGFHIYGLDYV